MTEWKITPGPWKISDTYKSFDICVSTENDCNDIAYCGGNASAFGDAADDMRQEWKANARAIAALPDLIAAAEKILESDGIEKLTDSAAVYRQGIEEMKAALAKAKGE